MQRLASIYLDIPALRPGTLGAYILAFLCAGVATALRLAIDPYVLGPQYITFVPAVIITALTSGLGAGLLSVVLSAAATIFFVLPPRSSFYLDHPGELVGVLLLILVGLSNVIIIAGLRFAVERYREREENERLLMREVNHRAKNMLGVVDAIAHRTAAQNPEDFAERFSERIQALSANQDLLVRNEWKGIEIEDLVRAQLPHFADLIGSRIVVDGPRLRLKAAGAQAVGLALHELATNAGKYGALSTATGRVEVRWGTDSDTLAMSWTEREGPPVSAPKRRGFGTTVMEAMVERSVEGVVDLDYAPSGVIWRLTCPAVNALEPWELNSGEAWPSSRL
jgi:two-component sensor histidine kinase